MSLTQEQKNKYLKNPNLCPYCNSGNIEGGPIEVNDGGATQNIYCVDCDTEWEDYYKLDDIIELGQ